MFPKHCPRCGAGFEPGDIWPKTCPGCNQQTWVNPTPAANVLLPCDEGLLVVRRAIKPVGKLSTPGGFVERGETWQQGAVRELLEEADIVLDPSELVLFWAENVPPSPLVLFGASKTILRMKDLPEFVPNDESLERLAIDKPQEMCFGIQTRTVAKFFEWWQGNEAEYLEKLRSLPQ